MCSSSISPESQNELCQQAQEFSGLELYSAKVLQGGDEALVLHVQSPESDWVIHASAPWRKADELRWCHRLIQDLQQHLSLAIAPLFQEQESLFFWQGRPVALFPFVSGTFLERTHMQQRQQAAQTLGQIHARLQSWKGPARPANHKAPRLPEPENWPAELHDPELENNWLMYLGSLPRIGLTHGDFYPGNLLCQENTLVAVIDWHEAQSRPLLWELASASFELCRDEQHELQAGACRDFIAAYFEAGGPVPPKELRYFKTVLRSGLRHDILNSIAWGSSWDDVYVQGQVKAFLSLKSYPDSALIPENLR